MALPNVTINFAPGNQLGGNPVGNFDNTFFVVGAALKAVPNVITPLTSISATRQLAGYGPGPEVCGQIFANGAGQAYFVAGNKSVVNDDTYDYGIGPITQSRPAGPAMTAVSMVGLAGTPLGPSFANTGEGDVFFDQASEPQVSINAALVEVLVTTTGALGSLEDSSAARGTVTASGSTVTVASGTPWTANQFVGDIFVDENGGPFAITGNTNNALMVTGSPAALSEIWSIVTAGTAIATITVGTSELVGVPLTATPWTAPYGYALTTSTFYGSGTISGSAFTLASGTPWNAGQFVGMVFVDKNGGYFTITANTDSTLTVSGSPASGTNATSGIYNPGEVVLDFAVPAGKTFNAGDLFSAEPTPNDGFQVVVVVNSINDAGQALVQYSLDNGVTFSGQRSLLLGGVLNITGNGAPVVTFDPSSEVPPTAQNTTLVCTQAGSASGVASQCTPSSGLFVGAGGNSGNLVANVTTASSYGLSVTAALAPHAGTSTTHLDVTMTNTSTGATIATHPNVANTAFPLTDSTTGLVVSIASGTQASGDTFANVVVNPEALFTQTVGSTVTTDVAIPSDGEWSSGLNGPVLDFPVGNTTEYPLGCTYQFWSYPGQFLSPTEADGTPDGIVMAFGFGVYQPGDTYSFPCAAPYVANADALNALSVITAQRAFPYAGIAFCTGVREEISGNLVSDWATAMNLASSVDSVLDGLVPGPTFLFKWAFVCGPDATSATPGATPNDFINASGSLSLDGTMTGAGLDLITSALTGRQDRRNHGVADIGRLANPALCPPQIDPGEFDQGPLLNVVSTTTTLNDATTFNANRAMVATTYENTAGVFEAQGLTLDQAGGDYSTVMNVRVINKAAFYAQQCLLKYLNKTVPTTRGTGTLTPAYAQIIDSDVESSVPKNCPGNFQSITCDMSTTDVLVPNGTETGTISIQPWGYITSIDATIGFTLGTPANG